MNLLYSVNRFIDTFITFYSVLIVLRIFLSWLPDIDWDKQPVKFVRLVCDPYLDIFRSFIPPLGGLDFSPIVALLFLNVLQIIAGMVIGAQT